MSDPAAGTNIETVKFSSNLVAAVALVAAAACWGFGFVMSKSSLDTLPPFTLLTIQLSASVLFLWLVVFVLRFSEIPKIKEQASPTMFASGVLEPGLAFTVQMPGLALTTASSTSLISATEPAFICVLAWALFKEKPSPGVTGATLAAIAGVALITYPSGGDDVSAGRQVLGDLLVLAGVAFAALYVVTSSRMAPHLDSLVLAAVQQSAGLAFVAVVMSLAVITGFETLPGTIPLPTIAWAGLIGIVQFALAFSLYLYGLKYLHVSTAGAFLTLIPVFGVGGAMVFLGESLTPLQWIGCAIVLASIMTLKIKQT